MPDARGFVYLVKFDSSMIEIQSVHLQDNKSDWNPQELISKLHYLDTQIVEFLGSAEVIAAKEIKHGYLISSDDVNWTLFLHSKWVSEFSHEHAFVEDRGDVLPEYMDFV